MFFLVAGVVDINPHKQEQYVPITGHRIFSPEFLKKEPPDHVLVMNPQYEKEIADSLTGMGVKAEIHSVY